MLRPSKHSHPDRTVVHIAALMIARLKAKRLEEYTSLRGFVKKNAPGGDPLFLPALNFLYLLGLVEYRPKVDAIEFLGPQ